MAHLDHIPHLISKEMNQVLMGEFLEAKVTLALKQMAPLKAPGPDGMPPLLVCVRTMTYSILINGEPQGMIHSSRGIRQGDPLSPFLFLLCTEGLHGLIQHAAMMGEIKGFFLCRQGPKLTHLLFADDSLLFYRSTPEECGQVLDILNQYEAASGQKVNKNKTTIFFSTSTPKDARQEIKSILGL